MPWVREETKIVLLLIAYWKFLSTSDCLSLHFGLPVSGLLHDLQQGREAHCSGVASPKEETLPSLVPLKIVETPAVSPLEIWALVSHCYWWVGHIPQGLGQQKKKKKAENPGYSVCGFYLSLSLAFSLLLLESSPTVFHHSGSQLTSADSFSPETLTSCFWTPDPHSLVRCSVTYSLRLKPWIASSSPCLLSTWFSAELWQIKTN